MEGIAEGGGVIRHPDTDGHDGLAGSVMRDYAHDWTDEQIEALERKFASTYAQAAQEMREKLNASYKEQQKAQEEWRERVKSGKATQEEYKAWLRGRANDRSFIRNLAQTLTNDANRADQLARDHINDAIPQVYAENANYAAYGIEKAIGYDTHSFDLYDQSTVRRLMGMSEHDQIIHEVIPVGPPRPDLQSLRVDLDAAKDVRWNRQKFTSAITQSILQGESTPKTAKRLMTVLNMDRNMAVRAARTAMTSAENAGRVDSYKRAERIGIKLEQQWIATLDERTRYSHRELDGQHVPVGEKFVAKSTGHELKFPGDPAAHPSETYNCRCTLVAWSPEMEAEDANTKRFTRLPKGMTYEEWKEGKKAERESKNNTSIAEGRNLTNSWVPTDKDSPLSIREIIKTQGFDGKHYHGGRGET